MSSFLRAAMHGDFPLLVKTMMKDNVNMNDRDEEGRTALHHACMSNNEALVNFLLRRSDVDTTITDKHGRTALQSTPQKFLQRITILFSKAADLKQRKWRKNKHNRKSQAENEEMLEETDVSESDIVSPATLRKVMVCLVLPFLFLIFYNGIFFATKFILVSLTFYYIFAGYFISEIAIRPPWYHHHPKSKRLTTKTPDYWQGWVHDPRTDFGLDYEDISFESTDNYTLRGWYVPPPSGSARDLGLVLVHGGGRDRRAWLRHVPFLHNAGYGCLLFDLREHGLSDGNMRGFTFGMKERYDVISASQFLRSKYGYTRVCAMGTSVGGASVLMAAAIDTMIDVVVAENAITTSATLLDQQMVTVIGGYFSQSHYSLLFFRWFRRVSTFWLNLRIGNKPSKHCQALHCIDAISPRPVLIMHGTIDTVVPVKHSHILYEAAKEPKELYLCESAFHCGLFNTKPEEYEGVVLNFLNKHSKCKDV